MNIQTAINEGSLLLKRNNIKSSLLDSEILMAEVLNKKREYILLHSKKKTKSIRLKLF